MQVNLLLDTSKPYDEAKVAVLDSAVQALYSGDPRKTVEVNEVLEKVQEDPNFWMQCDNILKFSKDWNTKFLCLLSVEINVKAKWGIISQEQRGEIRNYIANLIVSITENQEVFKNHKNILNKCNGILVQIIKQEWNSTWPNAIQDLASSCQANETLFENNLEIMTILTEEIFDECKQTMTKANQLKLKEKYADNIKTIYSLCDYLATTYIGDSTKVNPSLLKATVRTFNAFLKWAPLGFIFSTDLLDRILIGLVSEPKITVQVLQCLTETLSFPVSNLPESEMMAIRLKIVSFLKLFLPKLRTLFPPDRPLRQDRQELVALRSKPSASAQERTAVYNKLVFFDQTSKELALVAANLFKNHFEWLFEGVFQLHKMNNTSEYLELCNLLENLSAYMVEFTDIDSDSLFKICAEFWEDLTAKMVKIKTEAKKKNNVTNGGLLLDNSLLDIEAIFKKIFPGESFNKLFKIFVRKMPKPQEILIETNESGLPQRVSMENTENANMYNIIRNTLRYMAKINFESMSMIIYNMINVQSDPTKFEHAYMNSIVWAIGALEGVLEPKEEKHYIINILKNLLSLNSSRDSSVEKSFIVANILYITGVYSAFINSNWSLLSIILEKQLEFMSQQDLKCPGLEEMACNSFLKTSQVCKETMTTPHTKTQETDPVKKALEPIVWDILKGIEAKTKPMNVTNKLTFYEAIGNILSAIKEEPVLVEAIRVSLSSLISSWKNFLTSVDQNPDLLKQDQTLLDISFFVNVNEKLNASIGSRYSMVFEVIFKEMVTIYHFYSKVCLEEYTQNQNVLTFYTFKKMRTVRKDVLRMFTTFLASVDVPNRPHVVSKYFPDLSAMLEKFRTEPEPLREPETLLLFEKVINGYASLVQNSIGEILNSINEGVLPLISADFKSYPDHRENFFHFLQTIVAHAFEPLLSVSAGQLETVINCMLWSIKHQLASTSELGLETLLAFLSKTNEYGSVAQSFYEKYFLKIFNDILFVLLDRLHEGGFSLQARILRLLLQVLDSLKTSLSPAGGDNRVFLRGHVFEQLSKGFPNLAPSDHERNLGRLFGAPMEERPFEEALRDYLVELELFTAN